MGRHIFAEFTSALNRLFRDRPVLFICTYRPVEAMEMGSDPQLFRDVLAELRHKVEVEVSHGIDVDEYVSQRYARNLFSPELINHVQAITEGHALFVERLFSLWEESGVTSPMPTVDGQVVWDVALHANLSTVADLTLSEVLDERLRQMEWGLREVFDHCLDRGRRFHGAGRGTLAPT